MARLPTQRPSAPNPFTPSPVPLATVFVGREAELAAYHQALKEGPGHPNLFSYLVGARGYGKTAMLREIERLARMEGWVVLDVDASTGNLSSRLRRRIASQILAEGSGNQRFRSLLPELAIGIPGLATLTWRANAPEPTAAAALHENLDARSGLELLADATAERGAGVLVSIDEVHDAAPDDLRRVGNDVQLVLGSDPNRWVSLVGAGLPDLLEPGGLLDHVSTFLHRGHLVEVAELAPDEAALMLRAGFERAGLTVDPAVIDAGVAAANGHPWYLQLVGYHVVDALQQTSGSHITIEIARTGIAAADARATTTLFAPVWHRLSDLDQAMMAAIAAEGGSCTIKQVRDQLEWSPQMTNQYRNRLARRGLVVSPTRGQVRFTHRQTLDWLQEEFAPFDGDDESDAPLPDPYAPGGEQAARAHRAMVNSLPPAPRVSRCDVYGPRSKAPCVLRAGHKGQHRYR